MRVLVARDLSSLLFQLWGHLTVSRRRQFWLVVALVFLSALAEVISLGAVLPFLGVLVAPERVFEHPTVQDMATFLRITSATGMILPLTVIFAVTAFSAGAIRMLFLWLSVRFTFSCGGELSAEVYRRTLYQPYQVHVARNSSEVISALTSKVNIVVFGVLQPLPILISSFVLLVAITFALLYINPVVAISAIGFFGACYGLIAWRSRRKLETISRRIALEQTQSVKALQEGLGGIRDVVIDGTQPVFFRIFRQADEPLRRAQGESYFISVAPRYGIETLGMLAIAGLAYGLSLGPGGVSTAFPVLGAFAVGAQRLLPALQQAFSSWANLVSSQAALQDTIDLLSQPISRDALETQVDPLPFRSAIEFDSVRFRYSVSGPWVVDEVSLCIKKGCRIGLVGATGSGKSTIVDLLMGLLPPTEGRITVDSTQLDGDNTNAWRQNIAHVPQSIYLSDASIAENIAFGVSRELISMDRVRSAAKRAQIADFIEQMPEGYESLVGERGVRLSGGQRQRIGIARALYKRATVLVFDEATSALDSATEQSVMQAIENLDHELTIILIAHRLNTVRQCDLIIELERGRIVSSGRYQELMQTSASFRMLANGA